MQTRTLRGTPSTGEVSPHGGYIYASPQVVTKKEFVRTGDQPKAPPAFNLSTPEEQPLLNVTYPPPPRSSPEPSVEMVRAQTSHIPPQSRRPVHSSTCSFINLFIHQRGNALVHNNDKTVLKLCDVLKSHVFKSRDALGR